MRPEQNAGQKHNIQTSNKSYKMWQRSNISAQLLTNQNCIHEEIKRELNYSVRNRKKHVTFIMQYNVIVNVYVHLLALSSYRICWLYLHTEFVGFIFIPNLSSRFMSKNINCEIHISIILPPVLYGCGIWSLTLRKIHKLGTFQNRGLRKLFGPKRNKITGNWRSFMVCTRHQIVHVSSNEVEWDG